MALTSLTLKQLNRTLLARQLLVERKGRDPLDVFQQLIALQSQVPNPPYIGLWTRLESFERRQLTNLLEARRVARAPWIRSTLDLVMEEDHQRFQAVIQPALVRGLRSFFGKQVQAFDTDRLVALAKPFLDSQEPAIGALCAYLLEHQPNDNKEAMAYAVRSHPPLVLIPPAGTWGAGTRATYTTAEKWLGTADPAELPSPFRRYLASFGPASVMDLQTWTGMTNLRAQLAPHLDSLTNYQDENGKRIYDIPALPIVAEHTAAPISFSSRI